MKRFLLAALPILIMGGCIKKRLQPAAPPVVVSASDTVMYYWSFNTLDTANRAADFSVIAGAGTFNYYCAYIDTTAGTSIDALAGVDSGECLRVRNPSDSVIFYMPTTGFDSVVFEFAEEATGSGSPSNSIFYTTDGIHYINTALGPNNNYNVGLVFAAHSFDFSSDPNTSHCAKFAVAIVMNTSNTGTTGNDRFDNVTLRGVRK